jgi:hypothetical protein
MHTKIRIFQLKLYKFGWQVPKHIVWRKNHTKFSINKHFSTNGPVSEPMFILDEKYFDIFQGELWLNYPHMLLF